MTQNVTIASNTSVTYVPANVPVPASLSVGSIVNPVLDFFLGDLIKRVEMSITNIINSGANAAIEVEIEAGRQVALAIENAKNAYADMLTKTVDNLDRVAAARLSQLENMVQDFQEKNETFMRLAARDVQNFIDSLPFASPAARLYDFEPRNIVIEDNAEITLIFYGKFPLCEDPKYPPSLKFNNLSIPLKGSFTNRLEFRATIAALFPESETNTINRVHKFSYSSGTLSVQWDNTSRVRKLLGFIDTKTYEYKVLVCAMPLSPGKITAVYSKQIETPIIQPYASQTVIEDATNIRGNHCVLSPRPGVMPGVIAGSGGDWGYTKVYTYTPTPGCKFIEGSARAIIDKQQHVSDVTYPRGFKGVKLMHVYISKESSGQIDLTINLDTCGLHKGILNCHVEAYEIKMLDVTQIPYEIKWGESRQIPLKLAENEKFVKLVYTRFDGIIKEFYSITNRSDKYIKVYNQGGDSLNVQAIVSRELSALMARKG